jgi:HAD superfamily hydrolase (TIGR01509 family)
VFRATLFDYNGVIVDDEHVHLAAFRDVLGPLGITLAEADYWERYLGFDDAGAFRAILEDAGRPAPDVEVHRLIEAKRPCYEGRARGSLKGFPGIQALIRSRAARGPVAIVSGALRSEIVLGLELLGVTDAILGIVAAEDAPRSKPDPQGYELGLGLVQKAVTGVERERTLVIEDSIAGVQAAKAAGLVCVAVAHSYPEAALVEAGADRVLPNVAAVTEDALRDLGRQLGLG